MEMTRLRNRFMRGLARMAALAAAAVLTISGAVPNVAQAAAGSGSLTLIPRYGDSELSASEYNGTFYVYRVATGVEYGRYELTDAFKDYDGTGITKETLEALETSTDLRVLAEEITAWMAGQEREFEPDLEAEVGERYDMPYGLYLVTQGKSASGYNDCTPFLVMIPQYSENKTDSNVVAYPKVTKPSTPGGGGDHEPPTPPTHYGKVALGKADAVTGAALQGVVFNLYKLVDDQWVVIGTYTTDERGIVYVDRLSYGSYRFVEAQALEGYIEDTTPQEFLIHSEDLVQLAMTNTPIPEVVPEEPTHGFTGDDSNMLVYGAVAAGAAVLLVVWFVWNRKRKQED